MTANRLREAADLLRERAEHATPGPWRIWNDGHIGNPESHRGGMLMPTPGSNWDRQMPDATYIALMSPPVALALADWLDAESYDWAFAVERSDRSPDVAEREADADSRMALNVADAILGDRE